MVRPQSIARWSELVFSRTGLFIVSDTLSLQGEGFDVMKSGDARVVMIGFPSVGKVCPITRAQSVGESVT